MYEMIDHLNATVNILQNQISLISLSYLCKPSTFHLEVFVDGTAFLK